MGNQEYDPSRIARLRSELQELDKTVIEVNGRKMRPSQCYYFGLQPFHILYNTNCPDSIKTRVDEIISKYRIH